MFGDARGRKVVLIAHCLLNQNSIVLGLARRKAMVKELLELFDKYGLGVIQLPCPEILHCGLRRWWMTKEQYDNPGFRSLCLKLSEQVVQYLIEYRRNGVKIIGLIGVAGSPSCGVNTTCTGWRGGRPSVRYPLKRVEGQGVFMEILLDSLKSRNVLPKVVVEYDYDNAEKSLKLIESELKKALSTS